MKITPETTIRLANSETVSLVLDAPSECVSVRLTPRFGEVQCIDLDAGKAFNFPLLTCTPNVVKVEWLDTSSTTDAVFTNTVEVVSEHYFTLDALKNYNSGVDNFSDPELYSEEKLFAARAAATDVFETAAQRSFVKRIGRTKDYGRDNVQVLDHGDVDELLTDGYTLISDMRVERTVGGQAFPHFIEYIYGADSIPAEVSRVLLILAAYTLRPNTRPIGATGETTDAGYVHFTTAGRDGVTAVPEVNAAIAQYGRGGALIC